MRNVLYILLLILSMASCNTTKRSVKEDYEEIHTARQDSTGETKINIEASDYLEKHIVSYDSIVTHVTILRYDTIIRYGEPVIKEMIQIDQLQISRENNNEESGDSLSVSHIEQSNVSSNDSIRVKEQKEEKIKKVSREDLAIFIIFLLSIFPIYFCIQQLKNKP